MKKESIVSCKVVWTMAAMICCTIAANLLLKTGAMIGATQGGIVALLNWRILLGLGSFGAAGLLYSLVLRWLPLNLAQSFAALQFIGVIVAAALVLSEPISRGQWFGITLITLGIVAIGVTSR